MAQDKVIISIFRKYFMNTAPNVKDHRAGKLCPTSTNDMNPAPVHRLVGQISF